MSPPNPKTYEAIWAMLDKSEITTNKGVARALRCCPSTVAKAKMLREKGLPITKKTKARIEAERLIGLRTMKDPEIAQLTGLSTATVQGYRSSMGIPRVGYEDSNLIHLMRNSGVNIGSFSRHFRDIALEEREEFRNWCLASLGPHPDLASFAFSLIWQRFLNERKYQVAPESRSDPIER